MAHFSEIDEIIQAPSAPPADLRFRLQLFGEFKLWRGSEVVSHFYSDKVRALLVYLAIEGDEALRRTHLIDVLWPRYLRNSALTNLRKGLHELRKIFDGAECLTSTRQSIWLRRDTGEIWCDWWEVEDLLDEVSKHDHGSLSSCPGCRLKLERVQKIANGDVCPRLSINEPEAFDRWRGESSWEMAQRIRSLVALLHFNLEPRVLGNIPLPQSKLIGRAEELDYLTSLIRAQPHRLISLVGLGGVGKTHLALALARRLAKDFPDGAWLATFRGGMMLRREGGTIPTPHLVSVLGTTLGLYGTPTSSALLERLRDHRFLIIFDEFEDLLEDEAEALRRVNELAEIMGAIPGACLLLTSRVALRMEGELFYPLKGLAFPSLTAQGPELRESPSAQLFLSVRAARLDLPPPSPEEELIIGEICRLLEGLPLGVRLAGALSQSLPLPEVLDQLKNDPDSLESPYRDTPPRQRRLGGLLDKVASGLSPDERLVLVALSHWKGVIRLADLQAVLKGLLPQEPCRSTLSHLANSCLIEEDGGGHFRQHSLIQQLVKRRSLDWLQALGLPESTQGELRERVRIYFMEMLIGTRDDLMRGLLEARKPLTDSCSDILHSWSLSLEFGDIDRLVRAAEPFVDLSLQVGNSSDCIGRLESLMGAIRERGGEGEAKALGLVNMAMGRGFAGLSRHAESREAFLLAKGPWLSPGRECLRQVLLGVELLFLSQDGTGSQLIEEALKLATGEGLDFTMAQVVGMSCIGMWRARLGRPGALSLLEDSLALAKVGGLQRSQVRIIINLAGLRIVKGDPGGCLKLLEKGSQLVRAQELDELGVPVWMATGFALSYLGEMDRALGAYEEAAMEARRLGLPHSYVQAQLGSAHVLESLGDLGGAVERLEAVHPIAEVLGAPILLLRERVFMASLMVQMGDRYAEDSINALRDQVESLGYRPLEITFLQVELKWSLEHGSRARISALCDQLLAWIEENPGLPGTDSIGGYLLCYHALVLLEDPRSTLVIEESISLLRERLIKVRHLWRRRQMLEGSPTALALFRLLEKEHGLTYAQRALALDG